MRVATDLTADSVFQVVQPRLFPARDVTTVGRRIAALFVAEHPVFMVEIGGLARADTALVERVMDAHVLMRETLIHFDAARMGILPGRRRRARGARQCEPNAHNRDENFLFEIHNADSSFPT